jgi:hypothetical protein
METNFDNSIARERLTEALERWIHLGVKVRELAHDLTLAPAGNAMFPAATPGYSAPRP